METEVIFSKFLDGTATITLPKLREYWQQWSLEEKVDFLLAYQAKPSLVEEDFAILDFLMSVSDPIVPEMIALRFLKYPDRSKAIAYLRNQLKSSQEPKTNLIQALQLLSATEAIGDIDVIFVAGEGKYSSNDSDMDLFDWLESCHALWKLRGDEKYKKEIERFRATKSESVRAFVIHLLDESGA